MLSRSDVPIEMLVYAELVGDDSLWVQWLIDKAYAQGERALIADAFITKTIRGHFGYAAD